MRPRRIVSFLGRDVSKHIHTRTSPRAPLPTSVSQPRFCVFTPPTRFVTRHDTSHTPVAVAWYSATRRARLSYPSDMTKKVVVDATAASPIVPARGTTCARCGPASAAAPRRSSRHNPVSDLTRPDTCDACRRLRETRGRGTTRKTQDATCSGLGDVSASKAKRRRGGVGSIEKACKVDAIVCEDARETEQADNTWRESYDDAVVPVVPGRWHKFTDEVVEGFEGSSYPNRVFFHLVNEDASRRVQAICGVLRDDQTSPGVKYIEYTVSAALVDMARDKMGRPFQQVRRLEPFPNPADCVPYNADTLFVYNAAADVPRRDRGARVAGEGGPEKYVSLSNSVTVCSYKLRTLERSERARGGGRRERSRKIKMMRVMRGGSWIEEQAKKTLN
jgi:hypothetical protein